MLKYFLMAIFVLLKFSCASRDSGSACGNPNEPLYMQFEDTKEEKFLCPADTDDEEFKLKKLSERRYEMKYCLWDKIFKTGSEKLCQSEITPIFRMYENDENKPIPCGSDKNQFLYYFGYYYCGGKRELETFRNMELPKDKNSRIETPKLRIIAMYNVCFDVSKNKAVWTQHSIKSPQLFQDPSNIEYYCDKVIGKDHFYMNKNFFTYLEKRYEAAAQKRSFSDTIVLPQPLVPADHFAARSAKKTTNHYINRAPLWDKLVPLMTAIDQGIKTAVIETFRNTKVRLNEDLVIHTKTKTVHTMMTRLKKWFKIEPFEPNIWHKLVYDSIHHRGVMIYIHNTPGKPVEKKCQKEIYCNFKEWTRDMNIRNGISENELQYAYCCPISAVEALKEFSPADFDIREYFDINSMAIN